MTARTIKEIDDEIASLQERKKVLTEWPKHITYYLHANKETNYDIAAGLGLSDGEEDHSPAYRFAYTCYELRITLDVGQDGEAWITHVENIPLIKPVKAN